MMKAKIFSNDRETVSFEENDEEMLIKVESVMEISHYIVPFIKFVRFARKMKKEQKNKELSELEVKPDFDEESEEKPLKLKVGPVKIGLN